ncbi:MAG TPA: hypothetical protein VLL25_17535, partial [Acidimicrobiales bacterium]|nr:hypothetical protein [Acidimicrobiales bacterium]
LSCSPGHPEPSALPAASAWQPAPQAFSSQVTILALTAGVGGQPWVAVGSAVGLDGQPSTACFLSYDARSWTACRLAPVDLDGNHTRLLSVGRLGSTLVAGGVAVGALHGNPRPTLWRADPGQPLAELNLPRELFGGERIISFDGLATGPLGGFAVGTWDGVTNQAVAQVWRTTDGGDWQRLDGVTSMTSTSEELLRGSAVAVGPHHVVVVGAALHLHRLADGDEGAIWWSDDGRTWHRANPNGARLTGPGNQELSVVAAAGDGFVAGGSDSGAAALWWSPDGASWHWGALPAAAGPHARVTAVTSAAGRQWAAGVVNGVPRVWSSTDGNHWTLEPLPAGTPPTGVQSITMGAGDGELVMVVQGPEGPRTSVASIR